MQVPIPYLPPATSVPLHQPKIFLRMMRVGDWLVLGVGVVFIGLIIQHNWFQQTVAERLLIKQGGAVFLNVPLTHDFIVNVPGPLGITKIELNHRRARVQSDPGPRQLCVHQSWISHAGQVAICLPNQVSMEITGAQNQYDSLNY